jgi:hypothetical protein
VTSAGEGLLEGDVVVVVACEIGEEAPVVIGLPDALVEGAEAGGIRIQESDEPVGEWLVGLAGGVVWLHVEIGDMDGVVLSSQGSRSTGNAGVDELDEGGDALVTSIVDRDGEGRTSAKKTFPYMDIYACTWDKRCHKFGV